MVLNTICTTPVRFASLEEPIEHTIAVAETAIQNRHTEAAHLIRNSVDRVAENCKEDDEFEETQSNIDDLFAKLKEE